MGSVARRHVGWLALIAALVLGADARAARLAIRTYDTPTGNPVVLRMRMNYKRIDTPRDGVIEHQAIIDALRDNDIKQATKALKANIR